jgi:hypothetical protein
MGNLQERFKFVCDKYSINQNVYELYDVVESPIQFQNRPKMYTFRVIKKQEYIQQQKEILKEIKPIPPVILPLSLTCNECKNILDLKDISKISDTKLEQYMQCIFNSEKPVEKSEPEIIKPVIIPQPVIAKPVIIQPEEKPVAKSSEAEDFMTKYNKEILYGSIGLIAILLLYKMV